MQTTKIARKGRKTRNPTDQTTPASTEATHDNIAAVRDRILQEALADDLGAAMIAAAGVNPENADAMAGARAVARIAFLAIAEAFGRRGIEDVTTAAMNAHELARNDALVSTVLNTLARGPTEPSSELATLAGLVAARLTRRPTTTSADPMIA